VSKFWRGFLFALCIESLLQDSHGGLDGYIRYLESGNWVDGAITIPLAMAGVLAIAWYELTHREVKL
jgi:hypothetical protein